MATSLANYVITYCTKRGSPVYMCSLDAEGAFDTVPHAILFEKAINVIPDYCCVIMVKWYRSVSVQVKRGSILREPIKVCKGIPFLTVPVDFFYQDLINELSQCTGGININNASLMYFATLAI